MTATYSGNASYAGQAVSTNVTVPRLGKLIITALRASGPNGADDEYLEFYNPNSFPVLLDNWIFGSRFSPFRFGPNFGVLDPHAYFSVSGLSPSVAPRDLQLADSNWIPTWEAFLEAPSGERSDSIGSPRWARAAPSPLS